MPDHGLILIDKPAGVSSAKALHPYKEPGRKVGHAGTLDPFATGLLIVLVGDGTRLSDLVMGLPKAYEATVLFGRETDTLDPEGQVVAETDPGSEPDLGFLQEFRGEIEQMPPNYSALKVSGQRAYKLARAGQEVALKPRRVRIDHIEATRVAWPELDVVVRCGTGTYVRALARDFGRAVGVPAHLAALRRTHIGPFAVSDAGRFYTPRDVALAAGCTMCPLEREAAASFAAGRALSVGGNGRVAVAVGPLLVGFGEIIGGRLRASTVLSHARRELES